MYGFLYFISNAYAQLYRAVSFHMTHLVASSAGFAVVFLGLGLSTGDAQVAAHLDHSFSLQLHKLVHDFSLVLRRHRGIILQPDIRLNAGGQELLHERLNSQRVVQTCHRLDLIEAS